MSMNAEHSSLEVLLAELAAARAREQELLLRLTALLDAPAPGIPDHIAKVFQHAKELFGREAALFLATPHWELGHKIPIVLAQDERGARRVEELLARISYGIPV